jgi:hypothetical protein
MDASTLVGIVLVAGLVVFGVGAGGWRLAFEAPPHQALPRIHAEPRRWTWIHAWMVPAMFVTAAGVAGLPRVVAGGAAATIATMAGVVYALGALCWIVSLVFRLTVVPWAAGRTVADGEPPAGFVAFNDWSGMLYVVHMLAAYAAFAIIGAAVLADGTLAAWLGWLGIGWGATFAGGFLVTRAEGPFNPPFWAHMYTATVGVVLLVG